MAQKPGRMDAITFGIVVGATAGFLGGLLNTLLWRYILKHTHFAGIQLHEGFSEMIQSALQADNNTNKLDGFAALEKNILTLFDDFMVNKLTTKMPVLSMFIDDKLIEEIRVIFRDEMSANLPQLLQNTATTKTGSDMMDNMSKHIIQHVSGKLKRFVFLFIAIATFVGAITGLIIGSF
jgi:hypothetical protein